MSRFLLRGSRGALVLLVVAVVVGCGKAGSDGGGQQGASSQDVKTGPGVSSDTIQLGVLTDLSGVFAQLAKPTTQALKLYWKEQNDKGGVCGRQVELIVKDHGYDPQRAVALYRDLSPKVLALGELLGSPIAGALLPSLERDDMFTAMAGYPVSLLSSRVIGISGATYDLEMINGIDALVKRGLLKSGDAIGHLYFEGDYGESALLGSEYAAKQNGLKLVKQQIRPTDTDMTAQVAAFRREGVKAILVSAAPPQLGSAAAVAASIGLDVPIVTNGPAFDPGLLATPAGDALKQHVYVSTSQAPFSLAGTTPTMVRELWQRTYPKEAGASLSVMAAWVHGQLMTAVLQRACEDKDLTRSGVVSAFRELSDVDTGGMVAAPMDFTKLGEAAERAVYISRVDASKPGGTVLVGDGPFESANARSYRARQ